MPALEKFTNRSIGRRREEKNFNLKQTSRPWEASGTKVTVTVFNYRICYERQVCAKNPKILKPESSSSSTFIQQSVKNRSIGRRKEEKKTLI